MNGATTTTTTVTAAVATAATAAITDPFLITDEVLAKVISARNEIIGDAKDITVKALREVIEKTSKEDRFKIRMKAVIDNKYLVSENVNISKESSPLVITLNKNFSDVFEASRAIVEILSKSEPAEDTPMYAIWNLAKILTIQLNLNPNKEELAFYEKLFKQKFDEPNQHLPRMGPTNSVPLVSSSYIAGTVSPLRVYAVSEAFADVTVGGETVNAYFSYYTSQPVYCDYTLTDLGTGIYEGYFSCAYPGDYAITVHYASWSPPTDLALSPVSFTAY